MQRPEDSILLVSHGGILRYMMNTHPLITLQDERTNSKGDGQKPVESRFDNCEVRRYQLDWNTPVVDDDDSENKERRSILLTQIDH